MAKSSKSKDKKKDSKKINPIVRWWRETVGELRKVTWPTPHEAWRLTRIVIMVMVAMSALLAVLDFLFSKLITLILA